MDKASRQLITWPLASETHRRANGAFCSAADAATELVAGKADRRIPEWAAFHVATMVYDHHSVRALVVDGEAWFVLQDLELSLREAWKHLDHVPRRDRAVINTALFVRNSTALQVSGGANDVLLISEYGVVYQCLAHDDAATRDFVDWVIREAGPSIRAAGLIEGSFPRLPVKRTKVAPHSHQSPLDDQPTTLYRMLAAEGELLYVGISMSSLQRMMQHRSTKTWWREIAHIEFVHYPNRTEARAAERVSIADENPRYNLQG